jgi:hypothetical protein
MSKKDKLHATTLLLWGLASVNYILGTLGFVGDYSEVTFLGPVGDTLGFLYLISVVILIYIFTAISIVAVVHSTIKKQPLSVFAMLFSILLILFYIASFFFN